MKRMRTEIQYMKKVTKVNQAMRKSIHTIVSKTRMDSNLFMMMRVARRLI